MKLRRFLLAFPVRSAEVKEITRRTTLSAQPYSVLTMRSAKSFTNHIASHSGLMRTRLTYRPNEAPMFARPSCLRVLLV